MKKILEVLLAWESIFWESSERFPRMLSHVLRLGALVVRGLFQEKPLMRSAALTYTTTLTLIPTLAMIFGILDFLKVAERYQESIINKLSLFMTPEAADKLRQIILESVANINGGGLAGMSLLLVLLGVMTLISNVEQAFNAIWGIRKLRPLKQRFSSYLTLLVMGPIAMILVLTLLSAKNLGYLDDISYIGPFMHSTLAGALPFLIVCFFLFVLYYVIPNVQVSFSAAFAGSVLAGLCFAGNQLIAVILVGKFQTFNSIYGSLASIPIFLVGVFVAWIIILFGAHIAYAWQNLEGFRKEYLYRKISVSEQEILALKILLELAKNFSEKKQASNYEMMAEKWELPASLLRGILEKLETQHFVLHMGEREPHYVLARDLKEIRLKEVIQALRDHDAGLLAKQEADPVNRFYRIFLKKDDFKDATLGDMMAELKKGLADE
jgi:membrane protein